MADKSKERLELEARAKDMGVEFKANLGDGKLEDRVRKAEMAAEQNQTRTQNGGLAEAQRGADQAGGDAPTEPVQYLSITGPKRGRWRAGIHFSRNATVIMKSDLTEDQLAAIEMDGALTITEFEE